MSSKPRHGAGALRSAAENPPCSGNVKPEGEAEYTQFVL